MDGTGPALVRRGSMRKLLPSVPDQQQQLAMSSQLIDSRTSSPRGAHCYGPFFLEYALLAEYNLLQRQRLPGVYTVPAARTPLGESRTAGSRLAHFGGGVDG